MTEVVFLRFAAIGVGCSICQSGLEADLGCDAAKTELVIILPPTGIHP